MYLKGLELQGFKSFPDRIRLDFNKGITAVVGPNGSGKSNISDAVRWVLGEKSAKSLRGSKMEDIIFSGTADRKPMGFAEVSLIMDNSDHVLNIDYTEVSVTRKVYRSGESEYLINGKTCRQRDILELFMDTGVGKEGYSIIGQGRIDEILSTKSEDRRNLFEEAAGIVKYKTRCNETQNNLEKVQGDLVRIKDIIAELETQVGPLEKQAEKTKKYLVLSEELKKIQISIFVEDADKYEVEIKEFDKQLSQLRSDIDNNRTEQSRLEDKREEFRERLITIGSDLDDCGERLGERRSLSDKKGGDIRLCDNDIAHIKGHIVQTQGEIRSNCKAAEEGSERITALKAQLTGKKIELTAKSDRLEERRRALELINTTLAEGEEQVSRLNDEMYACLNRRNELNVTLSELTTVLRQYEESDKSSNEILSAYDGRLQQQETALAVQEQQAKGIELEGETIGTNLDRLDKEAAKAKELFEEKTAGQRAVQREISEKTSRLRVLSEFKNDYEGFYGGVKAILKERDNSSSRLKGIRGAVGEVITMPAELETAIEIALGGAVQNIIADTEEDVKAAIGYLKERRLGRATFLPMNAVRGRSIGSDRYNILNAVGVVGIAKELVTYDSIYEGIMSSLLDRVVVVDNIDHGIALARRTKYAYKIVTLEGDLFNPGGSMTGGSNSKKTAGIFSRTREITQLQTALEELKTRGATLDKELAALRERTEDINESISEAREELQRLAVEKKECAIKLEHIKEEIDNIQREKAEHVKRMEEAGKNIELTRERATRAEAELKEANTAIEELRTKMDAYNDSLKTHKESKDAGNEEIILMTGEINTLRGEYTSIEGDIRRTEEDIANLTEKNKQLAEAVKADEEAITHKEGEKAGLQAELDALREECARILEAQKTLNEEKGRVTALSDEYERRIRSVMQTVGGLENELTRITGKREQTDQKSRELYDRMFENYEITYVAAKSYPPLEMTYEAKKREESRLRGSIKQLGNVNVNAVEEYRAVKERYDTLTAQQQDIISTEAKLKEIIRQLTTLMEVQFTQQFKLISENFSRVFAEMFGGGKAAIKLADDRDVLNCGIEIEAQPPGKALQNMMLLSGGEKAMTAISILFAILEMKPSPFCILDEIEAALDEANVVRFAEYLRNFTDTTQFIVITHRAGTREVADMLYGVTQERGVSRLFSTNIDEIIKEREKNGDI